MKNILEELKYLRSKAFELDKLIEEQSKQIVDFADELTLYSLRNQKKYLNDKIDKISRDNNVVSLDLRLQSANILEEIVPISTLSDILAGIQDLIYSIGQAISSGVVNQRGPLPSDISRSCQMNLTSTYAGSFGMIIEGIAEKDILGYSPLEESTNRLKKVLQVEDNTEELIDVFSDLGSKTVNKYKNWLSKIEGSNTTINLKFKDDNGQTKVLTRTPEQIKTIRSSLDNIKEVHVNEVEITGTLMGASLITDKFEFVADGDDTLKISGKVVTEARGMMKEYFGKTCTARLQKEVFYNSSTDRSRTTWTLLKLLDQVKE